MLSICRTNFVAHWAYAERISSHAEHTWNRFHRMLSMRGNVKKLNISAELNTIFKNLMLQALGTIWFRFLQKKKKKNSCLCTFKVAVNYKGGGVVSSVLDPNPDPPDPHVFGPPGSGSISTCQRYGSRSGSCSGSFYHHAKIVRKPWFLLFCDSFLLFIFEKRCKCTFKK
jgi:hypothetical protein